MTTIRRSASAPSTWARICSGVGYHLDNLGRWLIVNAPAIGSTYAALLAPGELWLSTGHSSLLIIAAMVALFLAGAGWLQAGAPPGFRWLARMGRLSYELYLTHMFVVLAVFPAWRAWVEDPRWNFVPWLPAVLLCVAIGTGMVRGICRPILCGDFFADNFSYDRLPENFRNILRTCRASLLSAIERRS